MGDHSEAPQIDYDPTVLSYSRLLDHFWAAHNPIGAQRRSQYKIAVFYDGEDQRRLATARAASIEAKLQRPLTTEVTAANRFYRAEDYHQKYRLRRDSDWTSRLEAIYPDPNSFTDSTTATRLNGLLAGYEVPAAFRQQLGRWMPAG